MGMEIRKTSFSEPVTHISPAIMVHFTGLGLGIQPSQNKRVIFFICPLHSSFAMLRTECDGTLHKECRKQFPYSCMCSCFPTEHLSVKMSNTDAPCFHFGLCSRCSADLAVRWRMCWNCTSLILSKGLSSANIL